MYFEIFKFVKFADCLNFTLVRRLDYELCGIC